MTGSATTPDSDLYERDFYAWTQEQVHLLRQGHFAHIDLPNIIEEIETLGRKEVSDLRSRYRVLAQHLLKEIVQPQKSGPSWRTTILNQRIEIAQLILDNPSLQSKADDLFSQAYAEARKLAAAETGIALKTFPTAAPFTREQAVDQSWRPESTTDDD